MGWNRKIVSCCVAGVAACADPAGTEDGTTSTSSDGTTVGVADTGGSDSEVGTDDTTDGSESESDGDTETGADCLPGQCVGDTVDYECIIELSSGDQILGLVQRQTWTAGERKCFDGCTEPRPLVVAVDPSTGEWTDVAVGTLGVVPHGLEVTDDGDFIVGGIFQPFDFEPGDAWVERVSSEGDVLWDVEPPGGTPVSDIELAGDTILAVTPGALTAYEVADGSQLWSIPVDGSYLRRVAADSAGNVYLVGGSFNTSTVSLLKYDATQALAWEQQLAYPEGSTLTDPHVVVDGDMVVAVHGVNEPGQPTVTTLRKLDGDGLEVWSHTLMFGDDATPTDADRIRQMVRRPDGGIIATGLVDSGYGPALTFAYDADGNALWSESHEVQEADRQFNGALAAQAGTAYVQGCGDTLATGERYQWWLAYPE